MRTQPLTPASEIDAVSKLYQILPDVGVENAPISADTVAVSLSLSVPQTERIVRKLESLKVLSRRLSWESGRKQSFWKLLMPKDEALEKLKPVAVGKRDRNKQSVPSTDSVRNRMLQALEARESFDSVNDILQYIRKPNERLNIHGMTHILKALKDQGKVQFKITTNGSGPRGQGGKGNSVPYDIHLNPNMAPFKKPEVLAVIDTDKPVTARSLATEVLDELAAEPTEIPDAELVTRPHDIDWGKETDKAAYAEARDNAPAPEDEPAKVSEFPLIARIAMRKELLTRAAFLADEGGAQDISPILLELAEKPLSAIESEMVGLWKAYQECKGKI